MLLDEIADYLESQSLGTVGVDIFKAIHADTAPDKILVVMEYQGTPPIDYFGDNTAPSIETPNVQILARDTTYAGARQLAQDAYDVMVLIANETLGSVLYHRVSPIQVPFPLGQDENARTQVVCNYRVQKEKS